MNKELNAAEAVYGFVGWLTTREERTVMSAKDDCAPIAELIKRFCTENNLPEVSDQWPLNLIHPSGEVAVPNAAGMGDPLVTAAPAKADEPAPAQPKRQYYYKALGCNAADANDPCCICWYDEGTGPMAGEEDSIKTWRAAPAQLGLLRQEQ